MEHKKSALVLLVIAILYCALAVLVAFFLVTIGSAGNFTPEVAASKQAALDAAMLVIGCWILAPLLSLYLYVRTDYWASKVASCVSLIVPPLTFLVVLLINIV